MADSVHYTNGTFQSTLPRGERLRAAILSPKSRMISIHAPARGATSDRRVPSLHRKLFQSTLPRGERLEKIVDANVPKDFNPRSRRGATPLQTLYGRYIINISIHAPARGATCSRRRAASSNKEFQSTLPRGERPSSVNSSPLVFIFQSTLPRGERLQFYLKFTLCF